MLQSIADVVDDEEKIRQDACRGRRFPAEKMERGVKDWNKHLSWIVATPASVESVVWSP